MDLVENNKEGFKSCLESLNYLKEKRGRKCNPENPNYMDDELWGTIRFDSITDDMVVQTLKRLNLDTRNCFWIQLNYKSNFL